MGQKLFNYIMADDVTVLLAVLSVVKKLLP